MKHLLFVLSLFAVTDSLLAQRASEVFAEIPISMDELRDAKTISDLATSDLNWADAKGGEFTYVEAQRTALHVIKFEGSNFTDSILKFLAIAEPGGRIYIDNIRLPQDDDTMLVTNVGRIVQ